ncbi:MAG: conjugal transfer protein TraG N-terminal domain-containing protein [Burkholderiales bacterium]|nr:conjugal transfer protein TraG N-terminal domain-containing protein [Burkholderiales bacterium]
MTLDYFAYWNGAQVRDLFEAVVAITSGDSFQILIKCAVMAGFLVTCISALFKWRGIGATTFLFAVVLFYGILLIPKVNLSINDERAGTVHIVQNIPLGIGFFASATSKIGKYLTEGFEGAFSLPDSERFSKFGMVYPQRAVTALQNAGAVTPVGRAMVSRFVADCVTPELIDNSEKVNELAASTDLWSTITSSGWLNPARSSLQEDGTVVTCEKAATLLENYLNNTELDALKKRLGTLLNPDRVDPGAVIATSLPHAESLLLGLSRSLDASLKHSIMLQAVPEGLASLAKQSGAPLQLAVNLSKAQGNLASEINYRTMAEIAKDALPKIRNCVEFIIIASFPLVVVMLLASGSAAGTIFRSYFVLLIWVQLWAPLSAAANYLLITVDSNPLNRIVSEYGGNSLMAVDMIRQMGASSQAIAGYLMITIPMVALAIAKASDYAAVAMTGSLLSPAQAAAGSTSGQLSAGNFTSGNLSTDNTSMNTVSGNKNDLSSSYSDPYTSKTQTAYGSVTRSGDGTVTGMGRTGIDLGVSSTSAMQFSNAETTSSGTSSQLSSGFGSTFSVSKAANSSNRATADFMNTLVNQLSNGSRYSDGTSRQDSAGEGITATTTDTASRGLNTSENFGITTGAGLKVGGAGGEAVSASASNPAQANLVGADATATGKNKGFIGTVGQVLGGVAGFEAGAKTNTAQSLIDTATGADSSATAKDRRRAYSQVKSAAEDIAATASDSSVRSAAKAFSASLDKAFNAAENNGLQFTSTETAGSQSSHSVSGSDSTSVNDDVLVMNKLLSRGQSPEESLESLFWNSQDRHSLGAATAADNVDRAGSGRYMGQGQVSGPKTSERALLRKAEKAVDAKSAQDNKAVENQGAKDSSEVDSRSYRKAEEAVDIQTTKNYVSDLKSKQQAEMESTGKDAISEARSTAKASQDYIKREHGVQHVIGVALAGGILYEPPRKSK